MKALSFRCQSRLRCNSRSIRSKQSPLTAPLKALTFPAMGAKTPNVTQGKSGEDMMDRRTVLKTGMAAAGTLAMPAYLRAQSNKKISILTWNIADQEALFKEEFDDFKKTNPGVEIEWLDKKGPDLPAFYQTQLVAGTAPDVVDLQGELWVEWAAGGALLDLTPYLQKEPEII